MARAIFLDSFSGALADLKPRERTPENALAVLAKHPCVSTWDMSECVWLRTLVQQLQRRGLVESDPSEPYPWHRYTMTAAGHAAIAKAAPEAREP